VFSFCSAVVVVIDPPDVTVICAPASPAVRVFRVCRDGPVELLDEPLLGDPELSLSLSDPVEATVNDAPASPSVRVSRVCLDGPTDPPDESVCLSGRSDRPAGRIGIGGSGRISIGPGR
jgi:hypothetical protein